MQIAVGGCLAQKDRRRDRRAGALGRRRLRHPQHRLAAGAAGAGPGRSEEAQVEIEESLETLPVQPADPARLGVRGLGLDQRRLQQHLHLLHRARRCAARRPTGDRATSWPRSRRWSPRACRRSPCSARTSTRTGSSSATGSAFAKLLRACGEIDGLERVRFTSPHPKDFTDDVIAAMAETPNVMPQLHMPLQSGSDAVLRAMRRSYRSERYLRHHRQGPRRDAARRRSPPTSSSASRARPRRTSRPRWTWSRPSRFAGGVHLPVLDPGRHPGRDDAGPDARRPVVQERYERLVELVERDRLAARTRPRSAAPVEVMFADGEGRKDAATARMSGRARDNRLVHVAVPDDPALRPRPGDLGRDRRSPTPRRTT